MTSKSRLLLIPIFISVMVITGCAPAQLMPQFDETTLREKQNEIGRQVARSPKSISEDPNAVLSRIYNRVAPHARVACIENGEKWLGSSCSNWSVNVVEDENFNAYVTPTGDIFFNTEVFKYTESDDELAFILSHEISHHILNHAMEDVVNGEIMGATTGLLYGVLVGGIAAGLGASEDTVSDLIEGAMEDGYESGRESGRLTYSIDQESEADKLGLKLLHAAGYDQVAARNMVLYIGASTDALRSQHSDSHPSGPERLAALDYYSRLLQAQENMHSYARQLESSESELSAARDLAELEYARFVLPLAHRGEAFAQRTLAQMYFSGEGVLRDPREGVKWYLAAADQGDSIAQSVLGHLYRRNVESTRDSIRKYWVKNDNIIDDVYLNNMIQRWDESGYDYTSNAMLALDLLDMKEIDPQLSSLTSLYNYAPRPEISKTLLDDIDKNLTWFYHRDKTFLMVKNVTKESIGSLVFEFSAGNCGHHEEEKIFFRVHDIDIAPNGYKVISFERPPSMPLQWGCLTIIDLNIS